MSFYLIYCLLSDLILNKLSIRYFNTELYSYRLFTVIEYYCLSYFLYFLIQSRRLKVVVTLLNILFLVIVFLDSLTNSFDLFDSIPTGVESVFILMISIFLLHEKIFSTKNNIIFTGPVIIAFGFIIFFAGTFFLFILSQKNFNDQVFQTSYGYIVAIFSVVKNTIVTIGILRRNDFEFVTGKKFQSI